MAGTESDNDTFRRISPTEALKLVLSSGGPNRSIHDAAKDLTGQPCLERS
jgi:hypothetical protein